MATKKAAKKKTKKKTKGLPLGQAATFADLVALFDASSVGLQCGLNFIDSAYEMMSYYLARLGQVELAVECAHKVARPFWRVLTLAQVATQRPADEAARAALAAAEALARAEGLLESGSTRILASLAGAKALTGDASGAEALFEAALATERLTPGSSYPEQRAVMILALTRAGHGERAYAVLEAAAPEPLPPLALVEALVTLFEEGHTEPTLRLLTLLNEQSEQTDVKPLAAAVSALVKDGRHADALALLDAPADAPFGFGVCPYLVPVLLSHAASSDEGKQRAISTLDALCADLSTSDASTYLLALAGLDPDRSAAHLPNQLVELQQGRSQTLFAREVAQVAAQLGQAEAALAIDGDLRYPKQRVSLRAGLIRAGVEIQANLEAALAIVDDDAALERFGVEIERDRYFTLSELAQALYSADRAGATVLFDRLREPILKLRGQDKKFALSDLQYDQVAAGDLDGAFATFMKQTPAARLSQYNSLLDACAQRGELAAVIAVANKLKVAPGANDRAQALVHGFERAAHAALNG